MTNATWRIITRDPNGHDMPPVDYTSETQATHDITNIRNTGRFANLHQYNQFTGQWQDTGR